MYLKTKNTLIFLSIGVVIAFCYFKFFAIQYTDNQWSINNKNFNEANIAGRIEHIGIRNHATSLKIENNPIEFVFSPYTDTKLNEGRIFDEFAEKGDSVVKAPLSNILLLFKNKESYQYTLEKQLIH